MEGTKYQGRMHLLQKQLMAKYYAQLSHAAASGEPAAAYLLISGNPVELVRAFGMVPVYPEVNALQLAVKKLALPYIQRAEEIGYSVDNCAYVKADVGLYFGGMETPFAKIPKPDLLVCNYVGCNVYLHWFEHLAELTEAPLYNLDIPFTNSSDGTTTADRVAYVVRQLEELIELTERTLGRELDYRVLERTVSLSAQVGELWDRIKQLAKHRPVPFDAYFDAVTMMAPLYCLRGTEDAVIFFEAALQEVEERVEKGLSPVGEERFRIVIEGPPPWPYLRVFRDMFAKWGAVAVASTYSTVGGIWEFGFRHNPGKPLESIAEHMLTQNLTNRSLLLRYQQIKRYIDEWDADALVIHSIKSCRLFSAGQGDMREYFTKTLGIPTLLIESDMEDPRYFAPAQIMNRIDAFFESLQHKRLVRA